MIKKILEKENIDYLIIKNPNNIKYISGFGGSFGFLVFSKKNNLLITDLRYLSQEKERQEKTGNNFQVLELYEGKWKNLVKENSKIGIESDFLMVNDFLELKKDFKTCKFKKISGVFEKYRMIKSQSEIEKIKKACEIGTKTLEYILPKIKIGISEKEIAFEMEFFSRKNGASGLSFEPIVGFGKNSAIPHHKTGDTKLKKGDVVLVDYGVIFESYCSDMTRTFLTCQDEEIIKNYNLVLEAQKKGIENSKKGIKSSELYNLSNNVFLEQKKEKFFTHSLGHSLGLEIHERPFLRKKEKIVLDENMIITIEPGLYFEGKYGIRIEDTLLVKKDGNEILTNFDKKLKILDI